MALQNSASYETFWFTFAGRGLVLGLVAIIVSGITWSFDLALLAGAREVAGTGTVFGPAGGR